MHAIHTTVHALWILSSSLTRTHTHTQEHQEFLVGMVLTVSQAHKVSPAARDRLV